MTCHELSGMLGPGSGILGVYVEGWFLNLRGVP